MPNIKSAKKRVKVIATKTLRNKANRSELKTIIKKAEVALSGEGTQTVETVRFAIAKIDSAVTKGIMHKNTAARKKSKLQKKLNKAS